MKQHIVKILRSLGLLPLAERVRSLLEYRKQRGAIREFEAKHPDFPLPPWAIAYDAFSGLVPQDYVNLGNAHASRLTSYINKHLNSTNPLTVVDWGCGPARVLRRMPEILGAQHQFLGLDYNDKTIEWGKATFPNIDFRKNKLSPPLPLADASVDALYCISVFTHLSEQLTKSYIADIYRVLKSGGILIATLHGDKNALNLTPTEHSKYLAGDYVERGHVAEGKRIYVSYHPPGFVKSAFAKFNVLQNDKENEFDNFSQEWWIFRKP
jgi:ubiquinone/menaquinone biosynthesis C-methylase UbiE